MSLHKYRGRFAPSPTGLLHAGSLATALASWLDARAANGVWVIRIEDIDKFRVDANAAQGILQQLDKMGMTSDEPVLYQSNRIPLYMKALNALNEKELLYRCTCSRKKIAEATSITSPHLDLIYPGWCRPEKPSSCELPPTSGAIRARLPNPSIIRSENLNSTTGDFVLFRNDQVISYQLAVVVDDFSQAITHVVRGADLQTNTSRQIWLQQALGYPTPSYRHIPLVVGEDQEKLSKQNKAPVIWPNNTQEALIHLHAAGEHLGLNLEKPSETMTIGQWLGQAVQAWKLSH
jgi:glutamyl-Q tRNA(Asp) synthetase